MADERADWLLRDAVVYTANAGGEVFHDGAVAIRAGRIAAVGPTDEITGTWSAERELRLPRRVITPGLVNAHIHMTGPALFQGIEPADSPLEAHLEQWVMPPHIHATEADERAAVRHVAMLMLKQGTTAFIEPGLVRYLDPVLEALGEMKLKGALGEWSSDLWPMPFAPDSAEAARARMEHNLPLGDERLAIWPSVAGHNGVSDALYRHAAELAEAHGRHWTFHMNANPMDVQWFQEQYGERPLVHLHGLGVLSHRAVIAHGIHLDERELEILLETGTQVVYCPHCSLRVASGVSRLGRHPEMRHVGLGTDTLNVANHVDVLRSAQLACDLYTEFTGDRTAITPARALDWATRGGAEALGRAETLGSLEAGKAADIAVFDCGWPLFNTANALVHNTTRAEHVFIDGEHVLIDGHLPGEEQITADTEAAAEALAARAGLPRWTD